MLADSMVTSFLHAIVVCTLADFLFGGDTVALQPLFEFMAVEVAHLPERFEVRDLLKHSQLI